MKKSTIVSIVVSSLLISPLVLARHVQADEVGSNSVEPVLATSTDQESSPDKSVSEQVASSENAEVSKESSTENLGQKAVVEEAIDSNQSIGEKENHFDKAVPESSNVSDKSATDKGAVPEKPVADTGSDTEKKVDPREENNSATVTSNKEPGNDRSATRVSNPPKTTLADLSEVTGQARTEEDSKKEATVGEAVNQLLKWASTKEGQVGSTDQDRLAFAKSLGMIDQKAKGSDPVTDLVTMVAAAKKLHAAYRAERKTPLFMNGRAQPIFPFTRGDDPEHYSYENSDIVRYVVYVETDYDTDGDGKPDLVKTFVQVPKAAVKGDYKAPTIFEASPYVAGRRTYPRRAWSQRGWQI